MSDNQEWTPRVQRVTGGARERLQYVSSLLREDRLDEARDELLTMLHDDDKFVPARMMLGGLYMRQKLHSDALDQFKYAIELDPMQVQAHVRAGACCVRLQDFAYAQQLLQTALDLDPKQAAAHFVMAQAQAQTEQAEQAIQHLEEALRLDPQMAQARMLLARLLGEAGNVDAAIDELSGYVAANPDSAVAAARLAMLEARKGNHAKAIELLEGALKENPGAARAWDMLARVKMVVKDYAGAEQALNQAIEHKTEDRTVSLRLVEALVKQGKLDRAQELLKSVPRSGRMTSMVYQCYGDIYAARQLPDDAVESYRAAVLNTPQGERIVAEVDAAAGPGADSEAKIPHYQAAIAQIREELREEGRSSPDRAAAAGRRGTAGGGPGLRAGRR
jgi:tetratricopeptide (TPR) repeat protein